jgi:hypothetical protein
VTTTNQVYHPSSACFPHSGSWKEEPIASEMPAILALAEKVSKLKQLGLTGVSVVAN